LSKVLLDLISSSFQFGRECEIGLHTTVRLGEVRAIEFIRQEPMLIIVLKVQGIFFCSFIFIRPEPKLNNDLPPIVFLLPAFCQTLCYLHTSTKHERYYRSTSRYFTILRICQFSPTPQTSFKFLSRR
jgi:hypothetical protein